MANTAMKRWGIAWIALSIAIALHVVDEALSGFLPLYNSTVASWRDVYPWLPFPTFSFGTWLGGLIAGILLLFAVSPWVFSGRPFLRPVAYFLGLLMVLNALGHVAVSIYTRTLFPGVVSSPVLLIAALWLLIATKRAWEHDASPAGGMEDPL